MGKTIVQFYGAKDCNTYQVGATAYRWVRGRVFSWRISVKSESKTKKVEVICPETCSWIYSLWIISQHLSVLEHGASYQGALKTQNHPVGFNVSLNNSVPFLCWRSIWSLQWHSYCRYLIVLKSIRVCHFCWHSLLLQIKGPDRNELNNKWNIYCFFFCGHLIISTCLELYTNICWYLKCTSPRVCLLSTKLIWRVKNSYLFDAFSSFWLNFYIDFIFALNSANMLLLICQIIYCCFHYD